MLFYSLSMSRYGKILCTQYERNMEPIKSELAESGIKALPAMYSIHMEY